MKTYTVTLPDEFAAFVDRMIAEKKWDSVDHLVMYGLATVMGEIAADERMTPEEVAELRREIQIGTDASTIGEVAPLDLNAIWAEARQRLGLTPEPEAAHAAGGETRPG